MYTIALVLGQEYCPVLARCKILAAQQQFFYFMICQMFSVCNKSGLQANQFRTFKGGLRIIFFCNNSEHDQDVSGDIKETC